MRRPSLHRQFGAFGEPNAAPTSRWALGAALMLGGAACESAPAAASLPIWTASDHHSTDDDKPGAQAPQQPRGAASGEARTAGADLAPLVDVTWRQQCATCHGPLGKGDGQMGAMVGAPDLSRADWQARVSDDALVASIRQGKNRMPKFDLPDPVVRGLVVRIRSLRGG